jgi:hypothetical protein
MKRALIALVLLTCLASCGGGGNNPAGPDAGGSALAGLWVERSVVVNPIPARGSVCQTEVVLYAPTAAGGAFSRKTSDGLATAVTLTRDDATGFAYSLRLVYPGACTYTLDGDGDFAYVGSDRNQATGTGTEAWTLEGACEDEEPEPDQAWATAAYRLAETGSFSAAGTLADGRPIAVMTSQAITLRDDERTPARIEIHAVGDTRSLQFRVAENDLSVGADSLAPGDYDFEVADYDISGEYDCCPPSGTVETAISALTASRFTGSATIRYPGERITTIVFDLPILSLGSRPCPGQDDAPDTSGFAGTWVAPTYTGGTSRLVITELPSDGFEIHGYGFCGGPGPEDDCDWGITTGTVVGDSLQAVYEFGFMTQTMTLRLEPDGGLWMRRILVFHDGTNRDRTDIEMFVRASVKGIGRGSIAHSTPPGRKDA